MWSGRTTAAATRTILRPHGPLTSTRLPEGIDLKANGYCIVPPTIHPVTGQPYRWDDHPGRLPAVSAAEAADPAAAKADHASGFERVRCRIRYRPAARRSRCTEGNRNKTLYWASCRAAESGILDDQVEALLINAAVTAGETETKARRTVASARRTIS